MHVKRKKQEEPDGEGRGPGERTRTAKEEQSRATRAALIGTARELFAERGYAAVGTEEIVRAAGVTRGALYHHFAGKLELFDAVFEEVERELVEHLATVVGAGATDALQALQTGTQAFLEAAEDPAIQRITLLDAPAVLGWTRWREIGERYGLGLVRMSLQEAMDAGLIDAQPVGPLAHLLMGAIDEGAMLVARADDGGLTREQVSASLQRFLGSLAS